MSDLALKIQLIKALETKEKLLCEQSFEQFVKSAWHVLEPGTQLVWNWHLNVLCAYMQAVRDRKIKRLIINISPGEMKSLLVAVLYNAWIWTKDPAHRFLAVANSDRLATRDSQKTKWLVESSWYQKNWPVKILTDQAAKSQFGNDKYGVRQSIGISANVTGLRGDTQLWDDLISADDAYSEAEREAVKLAIDQKLISRLNDPNNGAIILIMQRLHEDDPTGHLLKAQKESWVHLRIPMEYEGSPAYDPGRDIDRPDLKDPRTTKGEIMSARVGRKSLEALKERLGEFGTAGQLQQIPVPASGGIIKKHWWRRWPADVPLPVCHHVFYSYDTAFSDKDVETSAYSACTRWGVFWHPTRERYCLMLLGRWFDRVGYNELRKKIVLLDENYKPDVNLIEKKATGISIIQDLKDSVAGVIKEYNPGKGEDKISRAHSVSPIFEMGLVYVPPAKWVDEIIELVAKFPNGAPPCADITDTVTQALIYIRKGNWFENRSDDDLRNEQIDK